MENQAESEFTCCPPFDPVLWDDKIFEWQDKKFIRDRIRTVFYIPMNFGKVMKNLDRIVREAGATVPGYLCLADHTSMWNMDVFLAVDKEIPGTACMVLSGRFYCKVYEGSFKETGKWVRDFQSRVRSKGLTSNRMYMWYTVCPKCAKKYGKNYVAIVSKVG